MVDALEGFANRLWTEPPAIGFSAGSDMHLAALAVWVAGLYGYTYEGPMFPQQRRRFVGQLRFRRSDDQVARRTAAWMRNPAADQALPPPVHWHVNGGIGFHPPGWPRDARAYPTPDAQLLMARMEERITWEFGRKPKRGRSDVPFPEVSPPAPTDRPTTT